MHIHVVQRGEVLWRIADYYNVSVQDIAELNGLSNPDILLPGQALLIPAAENTYTVREGDTIWQIAQNFGVNTQDLLWENKSCVLTPKF